MVAPNLPTFPPYPAGALGPAPGVVLGQDQVGALLSLSQRDHNASDRKRRFFQRWQIFTEKHKPLIWDRIGHVYYDAETKEALKPHVSVALNPALDITKAVAVVYKHPARRMVAGATDGEAAALQRVVVESRLDSMAPQWNRLAFFLGPVVVVPVIRNGRLTWDTLLPHFFDIVRDARDPYGPPLAVAWTVAADDELRASADTVVLDGMSWRYFRTAHGRTLPTLVDEVIHGLGVFPGSVLRFDTPFDTDWWGDTRNERLVDGTIDVGVINAALNFVRKSQNHKLLLLIGQLGQVASRQKKDPEASLNLNVAPGQRLEATALDFDTDPSRFIAHIRFVYESLIEAFGVPGHTVNFDTTQGSDGERVRLSHEGLTELRNEQIPFAREFEHDLMVKSARMMRVMAHPLAAEMPDDDKLVEGYRVEFPELARSFNDPAAEIAYTDFQLRVGLTSELRLLRKFHPTLDPVQAAQLQEEILEERATFHDEITKRNLAMDSTKGVQTAAQAFGRQGPIVRDAEPAGPPEGEPESE